MPRHIRMHTLLSSGSMQNRKKILKIGIAEIAVRVGLDKVLNEGHHPAKDESNIAAAIKAVYE